MQCTTHPDIRSLVCCVGTVGTISRQLEVDGERDERTSHLQTKRVEAYHDSWRKVLEICRGFGSVLCHMYLCFILQRKTKERTRDQGRGLSSYQDFVWVLWFGLRSPHTRSVSHSKVRTTLKWTRGRTRDWTVSAQLWFRCNEMGRHPKSGGTG